MLSPKSKLKERVHVPRIARVKSPDSMYHIMIRSISEFDLFRDDEDKIKYMKLIRKYLKKYGFAVYAYCLMSNHGHFIIDCLGADISYIMHGINFSYAQYYNRKYRRRGPVFQDRFKSKVIDSERYLVTLSGYIHNNPKDIKEYSDNVSSYPFSSLKEYLNQTNTFKILSTDFLERIICFTKEDSLNHYLKIVRNSNSEDIKLEVDFIAPQTEYKSNRIIIAREYKPEKVIAYVAQYLKLDYRSINVKYKPAYTQFRALSCFLMSCFCDITQKEICKILGNITQSRVSSLSLQGLEIAFAKKDFITQFIS